MFESFYSRGDDMEAITGAGLRKRYGDVEAVAGVDLAVERGEVFALLGPNGAGKTTTVNILTTLTRADAGEATVAGHDVRRETDAVRRRIGVVGQKPSHDGEATGRENLVLQGALHDLPGRALAARVDELLERFGLAEAANRRAKTYSGGMKRKLDVALGLLHRPEVLFLDEPTTGLDPEARAELWQEVERLAGDELMTILLTTHYLEEADNLASRLAIVDQGRIVVAGTPEELKRDLHGDSVQIELAHEAAPDAVRAALAGVFSDISIEGRTVRARARDGATSLPAALAALNGSADVASVLVARPSLDDVYLRHVGRRLAEAA
jgi:ABC-2 type transport system ATP-binding protein